VARSHREAARPDELSAASVRLHDRFADLIEADAGSDIQLLREALEQRMAAGSPTANLALRLAGSPQRRLLGSDGLSILASIADGLEPGSARQVALDEALGNWRRSAAAAGNRAVGSH
jgi:hypothetical protein